ncbi:hypothetical protein CBS101457_004039 [Exobasidium rhododendri]|nr:hypothetical protein CBS101457_004039 [Exobasidium rhododendri]
MLNLDAAWEKAGAGGLFKNDAIKRELSEEARVDVLKALVEEGNAAWESPLKGKSKKTDTGTKVFVFWKKPEEWADLIYNWVVETGQNRSIMTFFELTEGDLIMETDFGALPIPILRLALSTLEKKGKARVFEGSESGDTMAGVKFA